MGESSVESRSAAGPPASPRNQLPSRCTIPEIRVRPRAGPRSS